MTLSFGFIDWSLIQSFILKGLAFSVQLTLIGLVVAVFRQQGQVPRVNESPWGVAGNPAGVHDGQFRRTAAG